MPSGFDPCFRKHGNNPESNAAFLASQGHHAADCDTIERLIHGSQNGLTSADLELILRLPKHHFSGRLTEMRIAHRIMKAGRRDGCGVWVPYAAQGRLL